MALDLARWGNELYTGRKSYDIVGKRRRFYAASAILVVVCLLLLLVRGFNLGIEFRGGSEFVVTNAASTSQDLATEAVAEAGVTEPPKVTTVGTDGIRVQTAQLEKAEETAVREALAEAYDVTPEDVSASFVGPSWGKDVSSKALQGLVVFLLLVSVVMTIYFRNWRMAVAALVALFHDLIITVGVYAAVGWEVTPATVIGFLTILGYSLYDTMVVFDKVRENTEDVLEQRIDTYSERANLAVNQTLVRSINTSVVALLPVASILFIGAFVLGAGTLRDIALALFVGMAAGTFSSVFLATPIEVELRERETAIAAHTKKVLDSRVTVAEDGTTVVAPHVAGAPRPGHHLGNQAQPRKKKRK